MRLHPRALSGAILFAGAVFWAPAHALSMDALDTRSALGQPLSATVMLRGTGDMAPSAKCLRVTESGNGIPGPGAVRIGVQQADNAWRISLRSEQAINEPAVQFTLIFNCYDQQLSRDYSVLLDLPTEVVEPPAADGAAEAPPQVQPKAPAQTSRPAVRSKRSTPRKRTAARRPAAQTEAAQPAAAAPQEPARESVKLVVVPGTGGVSQREAELMAQAEDQATRLRQMELRIAELQALIEKLRVYVPDAEAERLRLASAASGGVALQASASLGTASAPIASPAAQQASAAMASAAAASAAAASSAAASSAAASEAKTGDGNPFDWMFWVWVAAAFLGIFAFLTYVIRQKRIEKMQAWGGTQINQELLDSYAPVRRAELVAKMNAEAAAMQIEAPAENDEIPVPPTEKTMAMSAFNVTPPEREASVEFVDVQHAGSAVEEAQWLISHGEGERAIALLREEIRNNPDQVDLWLMLFEYLFNQKKNLEFVTLAHRFRRQATGTDAWKKVCDMGLKLDPDNRLFLSRNS